MGVTSARQVLVGSHKTLDISSCSSLLPSPAFWLPPPWPHPPVRSSPSRFQSARSLLRKSSPRAAFQRPKRSAARPSKKPRKRGRLRLLDLFLVVPLATPP